MKAPFGSTALAELASSAPTSRPWRDTQASRRFDRTGCLKQLDSRRGEGETVEANGVKETSEGGKPAPKPYSSSSESMKAFFSGIFLNSFCFYFMGNVILHYGNSKR